MKTRSKEELAYKRTRELANQVSKELASRKASDRVVAQHLKLIASNIRHMEMHLMLIFPNIEDANTQGSVRDCYNSIARSLVEMAQAIEK